MGAHQPTWLEQHKELPHQDSVSCHGPWMLLKGYLFCYKTSLRGKSPALISCFPQNVLIKGSKIVTSASVLSEPIKVN